MVSFKCLFLGTVSTFVLAFAVLLGIFVKFTQFDSIGEVLYRFGTSAKSAWTILNFNDEEVNNFMSSLSVFDKEFVSTEEDFTKVRHYYHVINHLCAVGEVEKMYIPPALDLSTSIYGNQMKFEEEFADELMKGAREIQAKAKEARKAKFFETGCGRGRIAHHVASYTKQHVTGYNLDPSQIEMAKQYAAKTGMEDNLGFYINNHNVFPYPHDDETFDGVYNVQAWTYVTDHVKFFQELYRVLKPGGRLHTLEWVVLPAYDSTNAEHRRIMAATKTLIGAVRNPTPEDYTSAMIKAGFEIVYSEEASTIPEGRQWPLIMKADVYFTGLVKVVNFLVSWGLLPKHVKVLMDRLVQDGQLFVDGDKQNLFTTSWKIQARKPL